MNVKCSSCCHLHVYSETKFINRILLHSKLSHWFSHIQLMEIFLWLSNGFSKFAMLTLGGAGREKKSNLASFFFNLWWSYNNYLSKIGIWQFIKVLIVLFRFVFGKYIASKVVCEVICSFIRPKSETIIICIGKMFNNKFLKLWN